MQIKHSRARNFSYLVDVTFANGLIFIFAIASFANPAIATNLLKMSDRFDQMDKGDLDATLSKANQCTSVRDYACAEKQLREAKKYANDAKSKNSLKLAENALAAEKGRQREEERIAAERQRREEAREEQARIAEQRARDAEMQAQRQADEQANMNARIASVGNAYANTVRAQANARAEDQSRARQFDQQRAQVAANTAHEQQRFAQERAQIENQRVQQQQDNERILLAQSQATQRTQQAQVRQQELEQSQAAEAKRRSDADAQRRREATQVAVVTSMKKPSNSINTGRRAMECVQVTREKNDLRFVNTCSKQIFVVWCGDLKYSKENCGDGPGHSFYTHSVNIMAGDYQYARGIGNYHYAACEGGIGFGKEEIQDRPDGTFTCVPK